MKGRLVRIDRSPPNNIHLTIRTEDKKKKTTTIKGFKPYFYIQEDGKYRTIDNKSAKRVELENYEKVPKHRNRFDETHEADIPFVRRFLVDNGIRTGVEVPNKSPVDVDEIEPYEPDVDWRLCYLDIEVLGSLDVEEAPEPIISVAFYDSYTEKYFTLVLDRDNRNSGFNMDNAHLCSSESELLDGIEKYFKKINPDVVIAWNASYDVGYINSRFERLDRDFRIPTEVFDIQDGDDELNNRPSTRLKDVVVSEEVAKPEEVRQAMDVLDRYENEGAVQELAEYNHDDVRYMVELNEIHDHVEHFSSFKDLIGLDRFEKVFTAAVPIETEILRMISDEELVAPNSPDNETRERRKQRKREIKKKKGRIGGRIQTPPRDIFEDVAVFDMSKYYPSIILAWNMSPEVGGPEDELGILPRICLKAFKWRKRVEKKIDEAEPGTEKFNSLVNRKNSIKRFTNAIYGYTGYPGARFFDEEIMTGVTRKGREGLKVLEEVTNELGYNWLYCHTDSVVIQVPFEEAHDVRETLNERMVEYFKDKNPNINSDYIKLDFDRFYERVLFVGEKNRYFGKVIWEGGDCDYMKIVGFQDISMSPYAKESQKEICQMISDGKPKEEVRSKMVNILEEFEEQPLERVAYRKGIKKKLNNYKQETEQVRGAKMANLYLGEDLGKGSRPKVLWVKNVENVKKKTDVIAFENEVPNCKVNWKKQRNSTLKGNFEDILDVVGISWKDVVRESEGQTKLDGML